MNTAVARALVACIFVLVAFNAAQAADPIAGPYVRIEGALGDGNGGTGVSNWIASDSLLSPWSRGDTKVSDLKRGSIEAGWTFAGQDGWSYRIAVAASGLEGRYSNSQAVVGAAVIEPLTNTLYYGQIKKCDVTPCTYQSSASRHYWEVMPELAVEWQQSDHLRFEVGLQPFYGRTNLGSHAQTTGFTSFVDSSVSAHSYGALVKFEPKYLLSNGMMLALDLGAGPYMLTAHSLTMGSDPTRPGASDEDRLVGFRGRLGFGVDMPVSRALSAGLVARADYWSARTNVVGAGEPAPTCKSGGALIVCHASAAGNFDLGSSAQTDFFFGIRLTFRPFGL